VGCVRGQQSQQSARDSDRGRDRGRDSDIAARRVCSRGPLQPRAPSIAGVSSPQAAAGN
jgi:hypothetical protein